MYLFLPHKKEIVCVSKYLQLVTYYFTIFTDYIILKICLYLQFLQVYLQQEQFFERGMNTGELK